MKERPILFSTPMVQAILAGRKTMTRRIVKPQPCISAPNEEKAAILTSLMKSKCPYGQPGGSIWHTGLPPCDGWYYVNGEFKYKAVYLRIIKKEDYGIESDAITWGWNENDDPEDISSDGGPTIETIQWKRAGDRLWVRECFIDLEKTPVIGAGNEKYDGLKYWYRADNKNGMEVSGRYITSIHMPRAASRITLEITDVRVERLQDITEQDAIAEGVVSTAVLTDDGSDYTGLYASEHFKNLWQSINGPESWESNPWVWVITFKKIQP